MKKYLSGLLALFLCLTFLAACQSAQGDGWTIEAPEPLPAPTIEVIDLALPEPPAPYEPVRRAFPLVNTKRIYTTGITGVLTFVDAAGERIPLPARARDYWPVTQLEVASDLWEESAKTIMLLDEEGKMALMRPDGTVVTDFVYGSSASGGDNLMVAAQQNYVSVTRDVGPADSFGSTARCGVVDAITGKEVVPCIYNSLTLLPTCLYVMAEVDGQQKGKLLDYSGNVLCDLDTVTFSPYGIGGLTDSSAGYYYNREENQLCWMKKEAEVAIEKYGDLYILSRVEEERGQFLITIASEENPNLLTRYAKNVYYGEEGAPPVLYDGVSITLLSPEERVITVPYAPTEAQALSTIYAITYSPQQEEVQVVYDAHRVITLGLDGTVKGEVNLPYDYAMGPFRYRENQAAYVDENGKDIIPFGTYANMYFSGPFLLAAKSEGWGQVEVWDIYDEEGRLLLENAYGVIREFPTRERILVYKDQNTCGFLGLDGSFQKVPSAPGAVSRFLDP